jgi:predicted metalloendopeptidase
LSIEYQCCCCNVCSFQGNIADWWEGDTKTKFLEKAKCIIDQYGNYNDTQIGLKLNGITTQGENIADNGGVKEAFRGYGEATAAVGCCCQC